MLHAMEQLTDGPRDDQVKRAVIMFMKDMHIMSEGQSESQCLGDLNGAENLKFES